MDDAPGHHETAVPLEEHLGRDALCPFLVLGLGIGEGQPDLVDFTGRKEVVDELNLGAQEGHVVQALLHARLGTAPETVSLDVHTDEVPLGVPAGEAHGVFPLAATEFQCDGMLVSEDAAGPLAPVQARTVHDGLDVRLEHVGKSRILLPLPELVFAHDGRNYSA